jgi:peptidoglycan/xylan/chitin deacetylase (PgdA/CDA1 family)
VQGEKVPAVSVVVPARNAAATLSDALESLLRQTEPSFEAIVVDDGSSDETWHIAMLFADCDPRVRVLRRAGRGVSAARNAGLAVARGEWLLFLDADDWIEPDALRMLLSRAREPDEPDAVVCGWARVGPDGSRFGHQLWDRPHEAVDCFATTCAFAIHSCLVRRELVSGFDESLVTCEDWDLWQRVARSGARFAVVDTCLALYRMRPGAASSAARRMLPDGLEVIARGHGPGGRDPALMVQTRLACACYAAGLALGAGEDARPLLGELGDEDRDLDLDAETVAVCLLEALGLPACLPPARLPELWPAVDQPLAEFLEALELRAAPGLAQRTQRLLERMVLARAEGGATVGSTHAAHLELSRPIEDLRLGARVERLLCSAELEGGLLARVELPVCDGFVPSSVLADAVAAEVFWPLLCRFLGREGPEAWELFLHELWAGDADAAITAAAGWVTVEVSERVPEVWVGERALNVEVLVGGAPAGVVEVPARRGLVTAAELREAITNECGVELALVAVREALIGRPLTAGTTLRELLREAAGRQPQPLIDEDTLVLARWDRPVRSPASRRAALPLQAVSGLESGLALAERPIRARYEPAVHPRHATPGRSEQPPPPGGATASLPILMYHRIADDGPESLRRYRLSPSGFDEQLHRLSEQGYRGVTPREWQLACETRRPLRGKALMITFDDGYLDFAEQAWPLLERHGFTATVFVVTDAVRTTSAWDAEHGDTTPLMGWDEIRELSRRGIEFGSHTRTHPALCGLSNADVTRELLGARLKLEDELGKPVSALAYPYGDFDAAIAHLAGACGYTLGVTCESRHAELTDNPLTLPRFEVQGHFTLTDLDRTLSPH